MTLRRELRSLTAPVAAALTACALLPFAAPSARAEPENESAAARGDVALTLGRSIAALRAEVDALAADVEAARVERQDEQLALARRKTALVAQLDEARFTTVELGRKVEELTKASAAQTTAREAAAAPLRSALARLRAHIDSGVPVRLRERLARLQEAELALEDGGPVDALQRMRILVEAERALETSHERLRQPIEVGGKPVVADVVRLGLVHAFYRLKDGAVGEAVPSSEEAAPQAGDTPARRARWRPITDADTRARVLALFDALRGTGPTEVVLVPLPHTVSSVRAGGAP